MKLSLLRVLSLLVCIAAALCDQAKIVSCPGCKLNRLPKLKQFLWSDELKSYKDVTVSWERGKNPDLYIYDDNGDLKEKHDLSTMQVDEIKTLLQSRGFGPKQAAADL